MADTDFEIVIVGAGPAGCATALFIWAAAPRLAERIVVIDRAIFPRDKICAGAIGARADGWLEQVGVRIDVPHVPIRGLAVLTRHGRLVEERQRPIGRVVRRIEFDAALLDAVRNRGIEVRCGVAFQALRHSADGLLLSTSAGDLRAAAVVGADGVGSAVRRQLGLPRGRYYAQAVEVDTAALETERVDNLLRFDLSDASFPGYCWDFPTLIDGQRGFCRGMYQLTSGLEPDLPNQGDLGARLAQRLRDRGLDPEGLQLRRFAERGLSLREPCAARRALLVGEAAGIDPVLGEGITQAIGQGKVAGTYLAQCDDYQFADYRQALGDSRVGLDLRIRARALGFVYGKRRPVAEHWVSHSHSLARAGMSYFAGERVSRWQLAAAAGDLARSIAMSARGY